MGQQLLRTHRVGEEHGSLDGAHEVGGEGARLASRDAMGPELHLGPVDVGAQQTLRRPGEGSVGAELLELLAKAAVRAAKLDDAIGEVERCPDEAAKASSRLAVRARGP